MSAIRLSGLAGVLLLCLLFAPAAHSARLDTVTGLTAPTGLPISVYSTIVEVLLIHEAMAEWDDILCEKQNLFFEYVTGSFIIEWGDLGGDGTLALANIGGHSITLNSNAAVHWYKGFGTPGVNEYDLLTVIKHELGHCLGIAGDYGVTDGDGVGEPWDDKDGDHVADPGEYYDTNNDGQYSPDYVPPAWANSSNLMWGLVDPGSIAQRHVRYIDARDLDGPYTVHPEPGTWLMLASGLFGFAVLARRRTR